MMTMVAALLLPQTARAFPVDFGPGFTTHTINIDGDAVSVTTGTKLQMPGLSIGGDKANGVALGLQVRSIADNVTVVVLKNSGHWLMEENPQQTIAALTKSFWSLINAL
jgi:pimeloyl-ACP methyl ester carboxylesterase